VYRKLLALIGSGVLTTAIALAGAAPASATTRIVYNHPVTRIVYNHTVSANATIGDRIACGKLVIVVYYGAIASGSRIYIDRIDLRNDDLQHTLYFESDGEVTTTPSVHWPLPVNDRLGRHTIGPGVRQSWHWHKVIKLPMLWHFKIYDAFLEEPSICDEYAEISYRPSRVW
jgi:hypothetical protein